MRAALDPIGPENDAAILEACQWGEQVIAAWGTHGAHLNRGPQVEALLRASGPFGVAFGPVKGPGIPNIRFISPILSSPRFGHD